MKKNRRFSGRGSHDDYNRHIKEVFNELDGAPSTNIILMEEIVQKLDDGFQHDREGDTANDCCLLLGDVVIGKNKDNKRTLIGTTVTAIHGCADDLVQMLVDVMGQVKDVEEIIMEAAKRHVVRSVLGQKNGRG